MRTYRRGKAYFYCTASRMH